MTLPLAYSSGAPYRAYIRHIAASTGAVAMTVNAVPQDFAVPDLMGQFGSPFGTYSAPDFTISLAGTYKISLTTLTESTVDAPVIAPDAAIYVYLDTGSGYNLLFYNAGGASDEDDPREAAYNYFVLNLNPGDKLKVMEHTVNSPTNNLFPCTWAIEKLL